ncbi:hypothetical protein KDK95_11680 [Actinospica sp. MGRD01-02]|uniref:Carboxymuconolactone decarboxylase n=1 Tax=Actinospica acidithermotolerans TaxID=2828514 RepID=A0A941E8I5_9ACTN|nr:hypothetical protein [Actinospica acidithermotolerans]MBR7826966.1 hypothetical protein [Actinospica acidithermotolerans]
MRLKPLEAAAPAQGPFQVLLRSPELGSRMRALSSYCIADSALPLRLRELALLEAARAFEAQHSWHAHVGKARDCGIDGAALDRLARGEDPGFPRHDERLVHRFARQLLRNHAVDDGLFEEALECFGEQATVDLVGCLGTFTALAMLLNAFEVDLPDGATPPFPGPAHAAAA